MEKLFESKRGTFKVQGYTYQDRGVKGSNILVNQKKALSVQFLVLRGRFELKTCQ